MRTTVVIATRNRRDQLARTLRSLADLRPAPPVVVLDNASEDDTAAMVERDFPEADLVRLPRNEAAVARTLGVAMAGTPYVAFSDDDSWWAPDALPRAEKLFDAHASLGLVAAKPLVGPENSPDRVASLMASSPLGTEPGLPGPSVLGFLACAAVVRREAYLDTGGFSELLHFGAEEKLLAYDLAARGWKLCYVDEIHAHHHPTPNRSDHSFRRAQELRNNFLIAVLRRPLPAVLREGRRILRSALRERPGRTAATGALRLLPRALAARSRLPATVERQVRQLESEH